MDVLETGLRGVDEASRPRFSAARLGVSGLTRGARGSARVVAGTGLLALFAAELLPWASIALNPPVGSENDGTSYLVTGGASNGFSVHAFELPVGVQLGFQLGMVLILGILSLALFGQDRLARAAGSVAAGLATGVLLLIVGVVGATTGDKAANLYGTTTLNFLGADVTGSQGPGMFCAGLAAALLLIGAVLSARSAADTPTLVAATPGSGYPVAPAAGWGGPIPAVPTVREADRSSGPEVWRRPSHARDEPDDSVLDLTVSPLPATDHHIYVRPAE